MNQCDGCMQRAPLRGHLHIDKDGHAFMACERERYATPATAEGPAMTAPELPAIPVGDRFDDETKFRYLGHGGPSNLYDCWDDAITAYGRQCYAAGMEAAAQKCDRLTTALDHGGNEYRREASASQCAAAIRAACAPK
jgi:hypothetical protein